MLAQPVGDGAEDAGDESLGVGEKGGEKQAENDGCQDEAVEQYPRADVAQRFSQRSPGAPQPSHDENRSPEACQQDRVGQRAHITRRLQQACDPQQDDYRYAS